MLSETIKINNFDMYYEIHGEGEPLLLLHGFSGSSAGVVEKFESLSKQYQLIIPDLRGHGRSTNPAKKYTFKQSAEDVMQLLNHLKINNCRAVGFSGGGITLLHLTSLYPTLIDAMSIVSATPYFPEATQALIKEHSTKEKTVEEWENMRSKHVHGDEQIQLLWQQVTEFNDQPDDVNFKFEDLQKIHTKTLIVQGDRDPYYPIDVTIDLYKGLPNAFLWIVPNGGHVPIEDETLSLFIHYLDTYIFAK